MTYGWLHNLNDAKSNYRIHLNNGITLDERETDNIDQMKTLNEQTLWLANY